MKKNLPDFQPVNVFVLQANEPSFSFKKSLMRWCMAILLALPALVSVAQNAIVGTGFAPGWGGACGTNTDFQYFSPGAGGSWIRTSVANGTGNQYFRLGVDWSGQLRQHTLTIGSDVQVNAGTEYTLNNTCTTSGSMFIDVASTAHNYVFKTANAGTNPSYRFIYFRVDGAIRSITGVSVPGNVYAGNPATITASLDGALSPGQAVYLRYTTDAFASSSVVAMTGSGTSYTANIPALPLGSEVKYYCFTSGPGLTISHANADFYTINLNGNNGLNYGYTVQAQPAFNTIANGNWNNPATWEGGNVPNSETAVVNIKHNVNAIGNFSVKDITIEADKILSIFNVLTIADGGTVNNIGKLATNGKLRFAGAGTITNKNPDHLYDVEINGPVQLSGCSIKSMLEIKANGVVAAGPSPLISGTLYINTGGPYSRGNEWTTGQAVGTVKIGPGTTYTLCDVTVNAAYATNMDVVVENTGTFILDPLCGGNTGAPAGPLTEVNILTVGGTLNVQAGGAFIIQRGDVGSLLAGTRFTTVVNGNVLNNGTLSLNDDIGDDLVVKGNWTNNGVFTSGENSAAVGDPVRGEDGRAVIMRGSTLQTMNSTGTNSFHYLIIDNPAGVQSNANIQVVRGLSLQRGKLNLNGHQLSLGMIKNIGDENNPNNVIYGVLYGGNADSYAYGGALRRFVSNKTQIVANDEQYAPNLNSPYLFPVGSATDYRPFSITYTEYPTTAGQLELTHTAGAGVVSGSQPNVTDGDGVLISNHYADAYWTATETSGLTGGTYSVSYTCTNCNVGISNTEKIRAIKRSNDASAWTLPGTLVATTGTNASPTVGRSGVTGFSQFGIGYNPIVLPVRLISFTGRRTPQGNLLQWSSSAEINFSHYELQQSNDSREWTTLSAITGRGGNLQQDYSFTHAKATGINYYRLRMVDTDGTARLSHVVTLKGNEEIPGEITALYDRATGQVLLQYNGGEFAQGTQARVIDLSGRILTQRALQAANRAGIETGYLPAGVYFVQIQKGSDGQTVKVLVQ